MDPEVVEQTRSLLSRHSIRNNFFLAMWEFLDLDQPVGPLLDLLGQLGARAHVVCCPADTWMSQQQYKNMTAALPGLQVGTYGHSC